MKCSHGLAFEVRCPRCFTEAMAQCAEHKKISSVKAPEPKGVSTGPVQTLQDELDCMQRLS